MATAREIAYELERVLDERRDEYLNSHQAAALIGWQVQALYNNIDEVPHAKVGRLLRFKRKELLKHFGLL